MNAAAQVKDVNYLANTLKTLVDVPFLTPAQVSSSSLVSV
jgi:hypothetical protein